MTGGCTKRGAGQPHACSHAPQALSAAAPGGLDVLESRRRLAESGIGHLRPHEVKHANDCESKDTKGCGRLVGEKDAGEHGGEDRRRAPGPCPNPAGVGRPGGGAGGPQLGPDVSQSGPKTCATRAVTDLRLGGDPTVTAPRIFDPELESLVRTSSPIIEGQSKEVVPRIHGSWTVARSFGQIRAPPERPEFVPQTAYTARRRHCAGRPPS